MADDLGIGDLGCYGNDTLRYSALVEGLVALVVLLRCVSVCIWLNDAFKMCLYKARNSSVPQMSTPKKLFLDRKRESYTFQTA